MYDTDARGIDKGLGDVDNKTDNNQQARPRRPGAAKGADWDEFLFGLNLVQLPPASPPRLPTTLALEPCLVPDISALDILCLLYMSRPSVTAAELTAPIGIYA